MSQSTISDETLMALADGELPEAESAAVRARLATDPVAAVRFAAFVETAMLLRDSGKPETETISDELVAATRRHDAMLQPSAEDRPSDRPRLAVVTGGPRHARTGYAALSRVRASRWQLPMAAAVLLTIGGIAGYFAAPRESDRSHFPQVAVLAIPAAEAALTQALDTAQSGTDVPWSDASGQSGRITVLSTHRLEDGTLCREFEVSRGEVAVTGASCRRTGAWRTEIAALKPSRDGAYAPASGTTFVDDYLARLGSGGALSPEEEQAAMARGWSAR